MTNRVGVMDFSLKCTGLVIGNIDSETIIKEYLLKKNHNRKSFANRVKTLCANHQITLLIIGLPINMDNKLSEQAKNIKSIIHQIRQYLPTYKYIDESYSTKQAQQVKNIHFSKKPLDILAARLLFYKFIENPKQIFD